MRELTLSEKFKKWDNGECVYTVVEYALSKLKKGEKISQEALDLLRGCSICPVGNASCPEFFDIIIKAIHPSKGLKSQTIRICPHGCTTENCKLNK